ACYYLTPEWVDIPSDFAFMFEDGKFVRYDVGTGREIAPGGGKVGMDVDEIRSLYAGRVEETPHKYVEGGSYLGVADINGGKGRLVFATDADGKVASWRVGLRPQVDYVEGCGGRPRGAGWRGLTLSRGAPVPGGLPPDRRTARIPVTPGSGGRHVRSSRVVRARAGVPRAGRRLHRERY